jgi:hypothetical protein
MNMFRPFCLALLFASSVFFQSSVVIAAEPDAAQKERVTKLETLLTGAKMTGRFTILGKDDKPPAKEEYTIVSATKTDTGDIWLIKARIQYGDKDATGPVPVEILWAGDTPVITLTNVTIPGMGTFSSRVVIYDNMYAGTWRHYNVICHLFGTIAKGEKK